MGIGKQGSAQGWLLVDGYDFRSQHAQNVSYKVESPQELTHGIGDGWEKSSPSGVQKVTFTQTGAYFDNTSSNGAASGGTHEAFKSNEAVSRIVTLGLEGLTIGRGFIGFEGDYANVYEVLANLGKLTRANVQHTVSGQLDRGQILHALTTETANANTQGSSVDNTTVSQAVGITSSSVANPSVITTVVPHGRTTGDTVIISGHAGSTPSINGTEYAVTVVDATHFTIPVNVTVAGSDGTFTTGKTNAGAWLYLEVPQLVLGGYTNIIVTIRHSADNSTWADLQALAAVTTSPTALRVFVAGAVNRYTAQNIVWTGAGSNNSATYLAGIARQ